MASADPPFDLTQILATGTEEERRAKIVTDVEAAITAGGGSVERNDDWGTRAMTYQIDHQAEAEYHLLQFTGPPALLDSLSHTLRIDDGVLRFRVIKVLPGTPPLADTPPPVMVASAPSPSAPAAVAPVAEADDDE
jgi:small subunit ribosomal protein S6